MKNGIESLLVTGVCILAGISMAFARDPGRIPENRPVQEIRFVSGKWEDIIAKAKKDGKYIFVDAYTSWCGPCRELKDVTFKDKNAANYYNREFINYTVDMEKGEGTQLAERWDITAYPSLLFFTPEGKMVMKQVGYVDGKHLLEFGKQALARK